MPISRPVTNFFLIIPYCEVDVDTLALLKAVTETHPENKNLDFRFMHELGSLLGFLIILIAFYEKKASDNGEIRTHDGIARAS